MAVVQQIWLYESMGGMLPMCQIPQCGQMEHGLKYIAFYVKTYNTLHSCHNFPAGSWQAARDTRICETSLFQRDMGDIWRYFATTAM